MLSDSKQKCETLSMERRSSAFLSRSMSVEMLPLVLKMPLEPIEVDRNP